MQIEYGLLTDPEGRPVAVRVFEGNTADPAAFTEIAGVVQGHLRAEEDGHGRRPRHDHHRPHRGAQGTRRRSTGGSPRCAPRPSASSWPTTGRCSSVSVDEQDLAEITSDDFPGERLIACRNPALADERARKREDLLAATEKLLAPIAARVAAGRLSGAAAIGAKVGEVIGKYKMAKHFDVTITDDSLTVERKQDQIDDEARLDGIYVIRTPVPADDLDAAGAVTAYKNLKHVERDFRHIKSDDLDLRPVFHRLEKRVKGHVLICMLAAYLTWHLRQAWAPLTYTDEEPPAQANPVAPAQALGIRRRESLPPARRGRPPLPQLPRPARPPRHPHPQRAALRRHARRRPRPHRAHQRTTPGLRPHRSRHPAHPAQVARNRRQARRESAGQRRSRHPNHP